MEILIGSAISVVLAAAGYTSSQLSRLDRRLDVLEVNVAKNYVTREELDAKFDRLIIFFHRLEDKIDAHVSEDSCRIEDMKRRYHLDEF